MRLVRPDEVRQVIRRQEVLDGRVAEADRAAATWRLAEAGLVQRGLHLF